MSVVAYKNLLTSSGAVITASSSSAGFEVENAYDYKQYDWWRPNNLGQNIYLVTFGGSDFRAADYFAIWGHNLGSTSTTIKIQYFSSAVWNDAYSETLVSDNSTVYSGFSSQIASMWRAVFYTPINYLLYSQDFTNAVWTQVGAGSITSGDLLAPDGVSVADKVVDSDATIDQFYIRQLKTVSDDSIDRTYSIYLKKNSSVKTTIGLYLTGGTPISITSTITWATQTVTAGTITDEGNGWYRLSITLANNSTGNTTCLCRLYPAGPAVNDVGSVFAWGAQLEEKSTVSAYTKTTAAISSTAPTIAGIQIGERTTLETGLQAGLAIPSISPMIENKTAMSELGVNLGATIKRTGVKGSIQLNNMTPAWARSDLEPFIDHLNNGYPAVFAWDSVNYPSETLLIWKTDDISPPTYTSPLWMSINIPFEGIE